MQRLYKAFCLGCWLGNRSVACTIMTMCDFFLLLALNTDSCYDSLASFPGPTQLIVACSTEKRGEPGMFPHVSIT